MINQMSRIQDISIQDTDANVESVRSKLLYRSRVGFKKYGVTTERGDVDHEGWLRHLQEELLDACVYIEAALWNPQTESSGEGCNHLAVLQKVLDEGGVCGYGALLSPLEREAIKAAMNALVNQEGLANE